MKKRVILIIVSITFMLNGCLIDRIKQRLAYKQSIQKRAAEKKEVPAKKTKVVKYEPSKPTEPIYKNPEKIEVTPAAQPAAKPAVIPAKKKKPTVKKTKKKHYTVRKKKPRTLKPEPYSISSNEQDPELLGPQTTLKSNPLSQTDKNLKKKANK